jgi:hypothetical protein
MWSKTDEKPRDEYFLVSTALTIINDNPEPVNDVISAIQVMIFNSYLFNSPTCTTLKMTNSERYHQNH